MNDSQFILKAWNSLRERLTSLFFPALILNLKKKTLSFSPLPKPNNQFLLPARFEWNEYLTSNDKTGFYKFCQYLGKTSFNRGGGGKIGSQELLDYVWSNYDVDTCYWKGVWESLLRSLVWPSSCWKRYEIIIKK